MKQKIACTIAALMMANASINAQTSLQGRVYHHPNIMASVIEKEVDMNNADNKKKIIERLEKDEGRKLTKAELAKMDKVIKEKGKEIDAAKNCVATAMTVEFTSSTDFVMKQKTKVDDEALKAMGVGWLKRKALKASLAMLPESHKANYEVRGNKVIVINGNDRDTLTLSSDGKTLSGIYNKDTKYVLKRIK